MACWTGCSVPSLARRSSTVKSARPSSVGMNWMQALTALRTGWPSASSSPITTVQAPQSPSAHPSFVPVHWSCSRKCWSTVREAGTSCTSRRALRWKNRMVCVVIKKSETLRIGRALRENRRRIQRNQAERAHVDRHPKITISPQYLKKIPVNVSRLCERPDEGRRKSARNQRRGIEGTDGNERARLWRWYPRLQRLGQRRWTFVRGGAATSMAGNSRLCARLRPAMQRLQLSRKAGASPATGPNRPPSSTQLARNLRLPHKLPATDRNITANAIRPHCGSESPRMGG